MLDALWRPAALALVGVLRLWPRMLELLLVRFAFRKVLGARGRVAAFRALGADIGESVKISARTTIRTPSNVAIGEGARLGAVQIEAWGPVVIGRDVMISSDVSLFTAEHDVDSAVFEGVIAPIAIGDHAWLASHVRVLPGVSIGRCAVVGTSSVVTADVPAYAVVAGNPARPLRERARIDYTYRPSALGD